MKPSYSQQLASLDAVFAETLARDHTYLHKLSSRLGRGPAAFVGSGGTLAVAQLAASLHETRYQQAAQVCTALDALALSFQPDRGALLLSSSLKHADSHMVLETFRRRMFGTCGVLTHRSAESLDDLAGPDTVVVQMPELPVRDGFLATGSIMQMAMSLLRADLDLALPTTLDLDPNPEEDFREELLILTSPGLRCVATDFEVRLVESGLAAVQMTDYRNFAHGRHTGFNRRLERITVVALSDRDSEALALGTIKCLPAAADVRHWNAEHHWPSSVPSLLARSMVVAGAIGQQSGVDIGRPKVPEFGRELYRLPIKRRVRIGRSDGIERKLRAIEAVGGTSNNAQCLAALADWTHRLLGQKFGGLVLDYDGTVCWTSRRFELPSTDVRDRLISLLDDGLKLGFASGRGQSLHVDLRKWVPPSYWQSVLVGLYNGAVVLGLDDDLGDHRATTSWSTSVAGVISRELGSNDRLVERGVQVSIDNTSSRLSGSYIGDLLERSGIAARVVASAHSIDVLPRNTTKAAVLDRLESITGASVLSIGDQGSRLGNDFDLLDSREWTLSVDRCSSNLTRCWFVGDGRLVGPDLLREYLRRFVRGLDGFVLRVEST